MDRWDFYDDIPEYAARLHVHSEQSEDGSFSPLTMMEHQARADYYKIGRPFCHGTAGSDITANSLPDTCYAF